tara:strand:+ start:628 stop:1068 length:441 start_codon:yes stop_codon:yes gene_type:complete
MNNLVTKLSSVAALIGVIAAIGGGFIQYGKIQAKLLELDKRESVVNQTVDLNPVNEKISTLEVDLIDRIEKVDNKIVSVDLSGIEKDIKKLEERKVDLSPLNKSIKDLEKALAELSKEVAIVSKENELQNVLIEEIKTQASNPLSN